MLAVLLFVVQVGAVVGGDGKAKPDGGSAVCGAEQLPSARVDAGVVSLVDRSQRVTAPGGLRTIDAGAAHHHGIAQG